MKPTKSDSVSGVGVVIKAMQILNLFQTNRPYWSQVEIVRETGLPKSTVSRLVRYLASAGYLSLSEKRGRYSLGPTAVDLGRRASATFDLGVYCYGILDKLSVSTGETVMLTSLESSNQGVRCVEQIESTQEGLRVFEQIGGLFPLHAGAAPKAVLANLQSDCQDRYLSRPLRAITSHTLTDPEKLRQDLALTRQRGYALSYQETYEGVVGVGAAFFWSDQQPAGSLAIAFPKQRATRDMIESVGNLLIETAAEVSVLLNAQVKGNETDQRDTVVPGVKSA